MAEGAGVIAGARPGAVFPFPGVGFRVGHVILNPVKARGVIHVDIRDMPRRAYALKRVPGVLEMGNADAVIGHGAEHDHLGRGHPGKQRVEGVVDVGAEGVFLPGLCVIVGVGRRAHHGAKGIVGVVLPVVHRAEQGNDVGIQRHLFTPGDIRLAVGRACRVARGANAQHLHRDSRFRGDDGVIFQGGVDGGIGQRIANSRPFVARPVRISRGDHRLASAALSASLARAAALRRGERHG